VTNSRYPCSIELVLLSTLMHEKAYIKCKINSGNCPSPDSMAVVIKYMEERIEEIQSRL
jgi:hypothetical protein